MKSSPLNRRCATPSVASASDRRVGDHHSEVLEERQLRFSRRIHAFTSTLYSSTVETACICFKETLSSSVFHKWRVLSNLVRAWV